MNGKLAALALAAVVLLVARFAARSDDAKPPEVVLSHVFVALDGPTFRAARDSEFLTKAFAAADAGLPWFRPVDKDSTTIYLRGKRTYLELLGPGNRYKVPVAKVGVGFAVETRGAIGRVEGRLRKAPGGTVKRALRKWDFDAPKPVGWYEAVWREQADDAPLSWWVSEYHPDFLPALYPARPRAETGILREHFLAPRYAADRPFADLTGLSLALPEKQAEALAASLEVLGFASRRAGGALVLTGPDVVLRLTTPAGPDEPGLRSLTFRSNTKAASSTEEKVGPGLTVSYGRGAGTIAVRAAAKPAKLTAEQAQAVHSVLDVQFAPGGGKLAFSVGLPVKGVEQESQIWVVDAPSRKLRQFTTSGKSDRMPRWSPDGRRLAFLSNRAGQPQLYLMPTDGGEAERLTEGKNGVLSFEWSPDGKTIAFLAPEPKTAGEEKKEADKDDARVIRAADDAPRLWVVDHASKKVRQLTKGAWHITEVRWGPKGDQLFAVATDDPHATAWNNRLFAVSPADGAMKEIHAPAGPVANLQASPDGASLTYLAARKDGPAPHDLFLLPLAGGGPRNVTADGLDRRINDYAWQPDGRLLVVFEDGFRSRCALLKVDGKSEPVGGLEVNPFGRVARADSGLLAFVGQTATDLPEVWLKPPAGKAERITSFNKASREWGLVKPEIYQYASFDGMKVEAALYWPAGLARNVRAPLAVLVHGGPSLRWHDGFRAWIQLLVARGYAVFAPNIRGSSGYGWKFLEANRADWGGGDFKDVMAGVDDLIHKGVADPDRLGIAGWSYGGYMAAWAITQTTRFKVAVVGAGMSDLASEFGTETEPAYDAWYFGVPYERPEGFIRSSPITHIKKARTPTLILHPENDLIDPIGQAQQLYLGLKHYRVTCEYVVYPREGHELREEKHVVDSYRRLVRWFDTHLKRAGPGSK